MFLSRNIQFFILFGSFLVKIFAQFPFGTDRRANPPIPASSNGHLPPVPRQNNGGLSNTSGRPSPSRNIRITRSRDFNDRLQNPAIQFQEERPGVYRIQGVNRREIQEEPEVVATVIPQVMAELIPENNRIIDRIRRILNRKRNTDPGILIVEFESDDHESTLVQLNNQQERSPVSVTATRIRWFNRFLFTLR